MNSEYWNIFHDFSFSFGIRISASSFSLGLALIKLAKSGSIRTPALGRSQWVRPLLPPPAALQLCCLPPPPCSSRCSWSKHLQPAQQRHCLAPDCQHSEPPSQSSDGQRSLALLRPHVPLPASCHSCHLHPAGRQGCYQCMCGLWCWVGKMRWDDKMTRFTRQQDDRMILDPGSRWQDWKNTWSRSTLRTHVANIASSLKLSPI